MEKLTAEYVRSILDYDPQTGIFRWKIRFDINKEWNTVYANQLAGSYRDDGRLLICINYKKYLASRLAWLIMKGEWPEAEIDHRDTNRSNDKWENLRMATTGQNQHNKGRYANNTSGLKGVSWVASRKKWLAQISANGKNKNLGRFDTQEEAYAAYCEAAIKLHGEFARAA